MLKMEILKSTQVSWVAPRAIEVTQMKKKSYLPEEKYN